jgi:tetratricopeptide (TPR) repeat protein
MTRSGVELLCLLAFASGASAQNCAVAGRIDGLLLDKQKTTRVDAARMSVARGTKVLAVDDGMPVCERDVISAGAGVVAIVRVGNDAEKDNAITLYGEATISVDGPAGITARIGRIFALLRGVFDVRTNWGTLGARGTQFEVHATPDSASLVQLEGAVQLSGASGRLVNPLEQVEVSAPQAPKPVAAQDCDAILNAHSEIVSGTRPALPFEASGRNDDKQSIARDFATARTRLLCDKKPEYAPLLANAWANYAEPGGVLKLIEKVPPNASGRDAALYANSVGNAYRQAGWSRQALTWYQNALEIDARFAFPYNGSGDAHRDLALAALDAKDAATATKEFDLAEQSYLKSLDPGLWGKDGGTNRAIPMVNLGELALLRIALDPEKSAARLDNAQQWFEQALEVTNKSYVFAHLGLARVNFMRALAIPDVEVTGAEDWRQAAAAMAIAALTALARQPFLDKAKARLGEIAKQYPDFSAAALLAGEIDARFGGPKDAAAHFRRAISFDPHNVIAYAYLARVLPKKERPLYEGAFKSAAPATLVPIVQGRVQAAESAKPKAEVRDIRALSPSTTRLVFGYGYDGQWLPLTLRNTGTQAVTVGAISLSGDDAAMFEVRGERCANKQLAPNEGCDVEVHFNGDRQHARSARVVIGSSSGMETKVKLEAPARSEVTR